jgi:hypothetical protein
VVLFVFGGLAGTFTSVRGGAFNISGLCYHADMVDRTYNYLPAH